MYLVIAPAEDVANIKTQEALNNLISKIGTEGYTLKDGYYCQDYDSATATESVWNGRYYEDKIVAGPWRTHNGAYVVPANQHVTAFFFVAKSTSGDSLTVGNLLDAISFSTNLPEPSAEYGNVQVIKKAENIASEDLPYYKVHVNIKGVNTSYNETKDITFNGASDTSYVLFENLEDTDTYRVTEIPEFTNKTIEGRYKLESQTIEIKVPNESSTEIPYSTSNRIITLMVGKTVVVTLKNEYSSKEIPLTISKQVDGNMGNKTEKFKFKITAKKENIDQNFEGQYGGISVGSDGSFELSHGQSVTIKIPYGCVVNVEEDDYEQSGYKTSYQVKDNTETTAPGRVCSIGKIVTETSIVFTNSREVIIPTGLFDNGHPTGWLYLMAAAAGCFAFGFYRRRKKKLENGEECL